MLNYEGLTVRELKRIVNRGEATPTEIGLFVVYDMWEREHGRRTIVDNKLLRYIEEKWQFREYANELDYWLEFGAELKILELQAREQGLLAERAMLQAEALVGRTVLAFHGFFYRALHKQATEAGLEVKEKEWLEEADAAIKDIPYETEMENAIEEVRTYLANFLGYHSVLKAAEALLDIPLSWLLTPRSLAIAFTPWIERDTARWEISPELKEYWPDRADELKRLTERLTAAVYVQPSSDTIASVERILGAFLSPHWSMWAQAGIKLRELAGSSRGIADLLRLAELAAAELAHE